jgi:hypothetical protein
VQNAASGYWSIAMQSRAPTTAVNGLDTVFASALLEAAVQAAIEAREVLLVAYDLPGPAPLHALHPLADGAGVALVLAPAVAAGALAALALEVGAGDATRIAAPALEELRRANPPMRARRCAAVAERYRCRCTRRCQCSEGDDPCRRHELSSAADAARRRSVPARFVESRNEAFGEGPATVTLAAAPCCARS